MLNNDAFVISEEKCVIATFTKSSDSIDSLLVHLTIFEGGKIDLKQTITISYGALHQLYHDIREGNPNPRIVDLNLHEGVEIAHTPKGTNSIRIAQKRLYDVLVLAHKYYMNQDRAINDKYRK